MAKWEELPIADRAEYMKIAVKNGYRDIRSIREAYNRFDKGGFKKDDYTIWLENEARLNSKIWGIPYEEALNEMKNTKTYDYRKFYEAQKAEPNNPEFQRDFEGNAHYSDIGKSVYHPTASTGSYYSGRKDPKWNPTGAKFGEWLDNGHEYRMSDDMLKAGSSPYDTWNYLTDAEDSGVRLTDERGYMFRDYREPEETYIGGVLPAATVTGQRFDKGGNKHSAATRSANSTDEEYKQNLVSWAVNNEGALWKDTNEAAQARQWLRTHAPEELDSLYWVMDDEHRAKVDSRFLSDKVKERNMANTVREGINDAGRAVYKTVDTATAYAPGPIGTMNWLGHLGVDAAQGNYEKIVVDAAAAAIMGKGVELASKGIGMAYNAAANKVRSMAVARALEKSIENFAGEIPLEEVAPIIAEKVQTKPKVESTASLITEAERRGVPKHERTNVRTSEELPFTLVNRGDHYITVKDGNFVFEAPDKATKLATIHFTQNEPVISNNGGNWNHKSTTLLVPYGKIRKQVAPISIEPMDTFFPNYNGVSFSTEGSRALTGDRAVYDYYKAHGVDVEFSEEVEHLLKQYQILDQEAENYLKSRNMVPDLQYFELNKKARDIGDQIQQIHRDFTRKHSATPTIGSYRKLEQIEGLPSGVAELEDDALWATAAQRELGLRYHTAPNTHSILADTVPDPEPGFYFAELPQRQKDFVYWKEAHKADYRNLEAYGGPLTSYFNNPFSYANTVARGGILPASVVTANKFYTGGNLFFEGGYEGISGLAQKAWSNAKEGLVNTKEGLMAGARHVADSLKTKILGSAANDTIPSAVIEVPEEEIPIVEPKTYTVQRGDSLWKVAHENNLTLDELRKYNPQVKGNMIHPNDTLNLEKQQPSSHIEYENVKDVREREAALSSNQAKIQAVRHDENYVIIDKKNRTLSVYNPANELIYQTNQINTGKSGEDYNTITYVDKNGIIRSGAGNESTPAGITEITGIGTYHGVPSFTRKRVGDDKGDIASSLHFGNINQKKYNTSNGCVRVGGKQLEELQDFLTVGTKIYTLPEKAGSQFTLKDGKLSFVADDPYGNDEKGDKKRFWDDYNVYSDKSYNPLMIQANDAYKEKYEGKERHNANAQAYIAAIVNNKEALQKQFNLSSDTYNQLAELAVGLAEQESKFGTGFSLNPKHNYAIKQKAEGLVNTAKSLVGNTTYNSRGFTQIKLEADNEGMQKAYKKLGIDRDNILEADKSAIATMARLAYIYNTEVKGRKFKGEEDLSLEDILLYKWQGKNGELTKHTATPSKNTYIQNVKNYSKMFDFYSAKTVYDDQPEDITLS